MVEITCILYTFTPKEHETHICYIDMHAQRSAYHIKHHAAVYHNAMVSYLRVVALNAQLWTNSEGGTTGIGSIESFFALLEPPASFTSST